jgi:hypothetical protein
MNKNFMIKCKKEDRKMKVREKKKKLSKLLGNIVTSFKVFILMLITFVFN